MAISPEREAELDAVVKEFFRDFYRTNPKPKAVVVEDQVVRDADVEVSKADKNFPVGEDKVVRVRRPDYVTINMRAYEEQQAWKAEERQRHRQWLREHDPCRQGLYGPIDDEED